MSDPQADTNAAYLYRTIREQKAELLRQDRRPTAIVMSSGALMLLWQMGGYRYNTDPQTQDIDGYWGGLPVYRDDSDGGFSIRVEGEPALRPAPKARPKAPVWTDV